VTACHGLLDVSNPTLTQDQDIANTAGATARVGTVRLYFNDVISIIAANIALFTDEQTYDAMPSNQNLQALALDQRNSQEYENLFDVASDPHLGALDYIVTNAGIALAPVRAYADTSVRGDLLAQLFVMRGYAIVQMAEDICPGFPINDVSPTNEVVYSHPYTTDAALTYGIEQLDSALVDGRDSAQYLNLARVLKARALLDLGQYADVAATLANVPADFVYMPEISDNPLGPPCLACWEFGDRRAVGDSEGRNGMPFVSAHDSVRVPVTKTPYTRYANSSDTLYASQTYPTATTKLVLASGIEASLMRAEVALHNNDATWIDTLNVLRSTVGLTALSAPTADTAKVNLLYRERAFWLYFTGHRLGDMRRLIRNYGRDPETVFPTGAYPLGGSYGTATAIPFILVNQAAYNRNITSGCTTR